MPGERQEVQHMNQAWYQVISIAFGYLSTAIVVLIVLLSA